VNRLDEPVRVQRDLRDPQWSADATRSRLLQHRPRVTNDHQLLVGREDPHARAFRRADYGRLGRVASGIEPNSQVREPCAYLLADRPA
jgi:hypothetical protein